MIRGLITILGAFSSVLGFNEDILKLQQDDPKLIKTLKEEFLIAPLDKKVDYNFSIPMQMLGIKGQANQPIIVNKEIFKNRIYNGFFIEAGAYDGQEWSNSLFFELRKGWNGLLIEPHPDAFEKLKQRQRKAWLLGNCLSTKTTPEIVDFDAAGLLGGIIHDGKRPAGEVDPPIGSFKIGNGAKMVIGGKEDMDFKRRTVKALCLPLYSILQAVGNPTVHYFSLDVEGSEIQILKTIPFDKVDIKVLDIEIPHLGKVFPGSFEELDTFLTQQGYKLYTIIDKLDAIYVKNGYLEEIENAL